MSELEDRMVEITEADHNKEKRIKSNEYNVRDLWDTIKCPSIQIIEAPEEETKEMGRRK